MGRTATGSHVTMGGLGATGVSMGEARGGVFGAPGV